MPWTVYAILIVFGVFVLLMIIDPRLSCFGRKISSPLYPLKRKRKRKKKQRQLQTEDYGFSLIDEDMKLERPAVRKDDKNVQMDKMGRNMGKKILKTVDYGFHLDGDPENEKGEDSDITAGNQNK